MAKFLIAGMGMMAESRKPAELVKEVRVILGPTARTVEINKFLISQSGPF